MKKTKIDLGRKLFLGKETITGLTAGQQHHIAGGGPPTLGCTQPVTGCHPETYTCITAGNTCPYPVGGSCTNCQQTQPLPGGIICASDPVNGGC